MQTQATEQPSKVRRTCPRCKGRGDVGAKVNARNKGQRGEREVVRLLQDVANAVTTRLQVDPILLQRNQMQSWKGGDDIHGLDWIAFEVKFCEAEQLPAWWRQCLAQAAAKRAVPCLWYRSAGQPWKVRVRLYANTPGDRDQIEMDATVDSTDFLSWFENALVEQLVPEHCDEP